MKRNNKKGFTIVELVIVIGVIGILSAILIPTFVNVTQKANEAALKSNLANAYSAYAADAADGVVDEDPTKEIKFFEQGDVYLVNVDNDSLVYEFDGEWRLATSVPGTLSYVADTAAHSTFNGYIVEYEPA